MHTQYDEKCKAPSAFNSLCRCWWQIYLLYYNGPREQQRVWGVEKQRERKKTVGCLKPFCWSHRALQEQQRARLMVDLAHHGHIRTFPAGRQEAPGSKGRRMAGALGPTQRNTSSARLEGPCAGSAAPNSSPWLPACKQTYLLYTRQWHRGVRPFILLQPSGSENTEENSVW